jgi:hypothetical protein
LIDSPAVERNALVVVPTSFGKMGEVDGAAEDWAEESELASQDDDANADASAP